MVIVGAIWHAEFSGGPWAAVLQGFSQELRTQTIPLLPPDPTPEINRCQDYGGS